MTATARLAEPEITKMIGEPDVPPDSATHADEEHYAGNDWNVGTLMAGFVAAFKGIGIEDFEAKSDAFLRSTQHPTLGRGYLECAYKPMIELLAYLEANGSSNYIASGAVVTS